MFHEKIVCTYLYNISKYGYPPPAENTMQYLNEMAGMGFRSVELEGIREKHLLEVYDRRHEISSHLNKSGINLPYYCAVLPGLTSLNEREQQKQFELFEKGCETAKLFKSKGILDNAPLPPFEFPENIPVTRHYDEEILSNVSLPKSLKWEFIWDHIVNTYQNICDIAAKYGLTYQLHPALGLLASNTDGYLYFFEKVNRGNLKFNFDTANLYSIKENLNLALLRLAEHIDYIHISDNRGVKVEHLSIGYGKINWSIFFETLDFIGFSGYIGLDIGGSESDVDNLDLAYLNSAEFISDNWSFIK